MADENGSAASPAALAEAAAAGAAAACHAGELGPPPPAGPAAQGAGLGPADATEAAEAGGVRRVPEGEIGAGLPVVVGGASREQFVEALEQLWRERGKAVPPCLLLAGQEADPWHVWRELWSWGGPEAVTRSKLWATVGYSLRAPPSVTSVSGRLKRSYEAALAPLDQAIDEGRVELQRPLCTREPKDRALQIRPTTDGGVVAGIGLRRGGGRGGRGRARGRGRGRGRRRKRRSDDEGWSSGEEGGQQPQRRGGRAGASGGLGESGSEDEEGGQEQSGSGWSDDDDDDDDGKGDGGPPLGGARGSARTVASMRAAGPARGAAAGRREVIGQPALTTEAEALQAGQAVDYRRICPDGGRCVTGWRSGVVLSVEPGSVWEGGKRLLVRPHHPHLHRPQAGAGASAPPGPHDSPAAAALAAVAAAGLPALGAAAAEAAQRLLTQSGHLRHEVGGLLGAQTKPGSPRARQGCALGRQLDGASGVPQAAVAGQAAGPPEATAEPDENAPAWVPLLWRGPAYEPFAVPVVMVRLPCSQPPAPAAPAGGGDEAAAVAAAATTCAPPLPEQQPLQLAAGMLVEAQRHGSWWPAQVLATREQGQAEGEGGEQQGGHPAADPGLRPEGEERGCVVLRNLEPPEGDGQVWRCSRGHAIRAAHPRHEDGHGVLAAAWHQGDLTTLPALRKQLAPYTYAGGIQAFACLQHMT